MGLLNIGTGEGPQIIQLFGRGVRLKGKNLSLKREENPDYKLKVLQTLFIFGLSADYIESFLSTMENEGLEYNDIEIQIKFNRTDEWLKNIWTIKTKDEFDFKRIPVELKMDESIVEKIIIDLRPKITLRHGIGSMSEVVPNAQEPVEIKEYHLKVLNWDYLFSKVIEYKLSERMYNLAINEKELKEIVQSKKYKIYISKKEFDLKSYDNIKKWNELILQVLKNYILKYYKNVEKRTMMDYLTVEALDKDNEDIFPEGKKIILKIPSELRDEIERVNEQLKNYSETNTPDEWEKEDYFIIHFDRHLYTPLIVWQKGKEEIKSIPVKLNKGESKFVLDFKEYLKTNDFTLKGKKIFLLRNLSRRGIGFFINAGFYPDFIIWVLSEKKQRIIFVDPKGIRNTGNFNDEKIQFCVSYIKDIEKKIGKEDLELKAYILSVSRYDDIKRIFDDGRKTIQDFTNHNVIFQEDVEYEKNGKMINYISLFLET